MSMGTSVGNAVKWYFEQLKANPNADKVALKNKACQDHELSALDGVTFYTLVKDEKKTK